MAKNGELAAFLRSRRARLRPADVGLSGDGRRRVPGLRREEVAMLAGVSLDYYARLEQGRDLQPSDQVLDSVARALRLPEVERTHLHHVVRTSLTVPRPDAIVLEPLDAGMRVLLDGLATPAFIVDVRGDVHAMNRLAQALLVGLEPGGSHPRWLFLDLGTRELLVDWEMNARVSVGVLREAAGRYPHDRRLQALIGELSIASPEFASWWAAHEVDARCRGSKRLHHPVVGPLTLQVEALALPDGERWIYAYAPEPGSASAEALALLGSWDAESRAAPRLAPDAGVEADPVVGVGVRGGVGVGVGVGVAVVEARGEASGMLAEIASASVR